MTDPTTSAAEPPAPATQIYHVFIRATPEAIWEAITNPEFTARYFYGARNEITAEQHRSTGPNGEDWGTSPTLEFDPPRRLVHTWSSAYDDDLGAERPSRVTWEIRPEGEVCLLTVTHDRLEGAPRTADHVRGEGWMMVLSGLKTLLETGEPLVR
ncbi:SRPBCC domain-containing protein [Occultella kanbiaonis]|uniref:SRPBCC domain-containing protein n=1 Tax=Occultella kanbiaonis TaxID=2675754 RepID=UPI00143D1AEF|nr:SRPBCC domain-containing protein [Occultella kanbiaonis]